MVCKTSECICDAMPAVDFVAVAYVLKSFAAWVAAVIIAATEAMTLKGSICVWDGDQK